MIPLFKPYMPSLPEADHVLYSGQLNAGAYTRQFEDALKAYFGTELVLVTNTFGMAISLATHALQMCYGDEIIASPMACLVSLQPYLTSGLRVKWADVDPKRGTLDPASVRAAITPRTKAIVHNHFCGYPGYIDEINSIGREYGIPVIDDCIEAFGSLSKGNKIGNCGTDVTVFSLGAVRIPNTIDGGVVIFKNKEKYEKAKLIRDCGINRSVFRDDIGEISPDCDICDQGFCATLSNFNAYIGVEQMKVAQDLIDRQRDQAQIWNRYFSSDRDYLPVSVSDGAPNYWVYGVLTQKKSKREAILEFREKGFYASGVHINNNIYSVFGDQRELPGVKDFYSGFLALPCGWWMNDGK